MKKIIYLLILTLGIMSCSSDDKIPEQEFEFVKEYSTEVLVGGVVGVFNRTFKTGENYTGTDEGKETIRIRIAEHTVLNDNCPGNTCYQEFLDVPREYLKFTE